MGKNLRNAKNYNIGLDIGTASVGWAVTDENGELYYFKGKPTWGSRLFPQASPASSARVSRGQRRRYDRRRQRLDLLQELFLAEMAKVDEEFFIRLRQARLLPEDRDASHADYRWPLFNGSSFTERDYYEKFPTIYHLRAWLTEADEEADLRLIYLALHNIVKCRGNFLHQDNPSLSARNATMEQSVQRLCEALELWCDENGFECRVENAEIRSVLEDTSLSRRQKQESLIPLFGLGTEGKHRAKEIAGAILGYKADFGKIYNIEGDKLKFDLGNDELVEEFVASCPDDGMELFESIQAAHSAYVLLGILKGANGKTLSFCKIREYERYGENLRTLKQLVREYVPSEYDAFFRGPHYDAPYQKDYDPEKAMGYTRYNLGTSKRNYEDFAKDVKKLFAGSGAESDSRYAKMMREFDEGTFLRRLKTSDNGSIPYQLHLEEMQLIIEKQGRYYPFLIENRAKLESLVTFRIPYYVGPLTTKNARRKYDDPNGEMRFAWSKRLPGQENTKVHPWNWEEVIDKDASAESFIRRMTGTCTYIQGEPVLPRCSLLYEMFCVLNELNGAHWTQDGDKEHRFCASDRMDIVEELFKKGSVTYKKVEDWLAQHNRSHAHVSGGQGESRFESKLGSHVFFCKLLGVDDLDGDLIPMVEDLILWNTLFEDRSILRDRIKRVYGDRLTDEQIRKVCKKRFSGWGRLSKEFLCGVKAQTANGPKSIMDILVEGNPEGMHVGSAMVLMEVLHDEHFGFEALIDAKNKERAEAQGGLAIDELPGSPALRRGVNQAMRIVEEIARIARTSPANIFIEVTRDEDLKKKGSRTTRRYDGLKEALANLKAEGADCLSELKGRVNPEMLDDALSLYFMQNAKCMYCGKPLDIDHVLSHDQAYQIDHIIPQSYVKDDSFENRVLVHAGCNQSKSDALLIDPAIRARMRGYWGALRDAGLIGVKKYNNLLRDHISDKQMRGFINRQLVETSQVVKLVRMMLEETYPSANVQSIKASLSHQIRVECGFVKCREANDFHHAHDAYLAEEMGRFIQFRHGKLFDNPVAATRAMRDFVRSQSEYYKKHHRMPGSASFLAGSFLTSGFDKETGEVFRDSWDAEAECARIRRYFDFRQCYISRMPEITSGTFWDATIYSPKNSSKKLALPLKKGLDPAKYGSYSREQFACFFIYKAYKKGKAVFDLAPLPVRVYSTLEGDISGLESYARQLAESNGWVFERVERPVIAKYQMIEVDGERLYITGLKEVRNATELAFDGRETKMLSALNGDNALTDDELKELFDRIVCQYSVNARRLYAQMGVGELDDAYCAASTQDKMRVVRSLVAIANASTNMIDLSSVGGTKCAGCMKLSFQSILSSGRSRFAIVDQSVTGMFERRRRIGI